MAISATHPQASAAHEGGRGPDVSSNGPNGSREVLRNLAAVLRLAAPQKYVITLFVAIYFFASFVHMIGLASFNTGFAVMGAGSEAPAEVNAWAGKILHALPVPSHFAWLFFFSVFLAVSVFAAAIDHLGWIIRLKLLAAYEAGQTVNGLQLIGEVDPRSRINMSQREMVMALRGDCKSARVVLQMILLSTVAFVQVVFPFLYIFSLDSGMSLLGLAILALGFYPIILLGRKAGRMSLPRQELAIAAGSNVSSALVNLEEVSLLGGAKSGAIREARQAIRRQQDLWRKQYEIRSLSQKVPQLCSLLGTYVLVIWGVAKVHGGLLTWGELMTFTIAARLVFQPFTVIGKNWAKTAEHYPRARRHLLFTSLLEKAQQDADARHAFAEPVHTLTLNGQQFPDEHGRLVSLPHCTLKLGSVLCIVDPAHHQRNPLLKYITGTRAIEHGDICVNGTSLNHITYSSIIQCIREVQRIPKVTGSFLGCMHNVSPGASAQRIRTFTELLLGDQHKSCFPNGVENELLVRERKRDAGMVSRYSVLESFILHEKDCSLYWIDFADIQHPERRAVLLSFFRQFRRNYITIWKDIAPREELGDQTVAVFRQGAFLGIGDLKWFHTSFPDWEGQVAATTAAARMPALDVGAWETIENELLFEEEA